MSAKQDLLDYLLATRGIFEITADSAAKATGGYEDKPDLRDPTAYTLIDWHDPWVFKPGDKVEHRYFLIPNPGDVRSKALDLKGQADAEAESGEDS